ncbi:ABC transporter permease [Natronosalvus rutilus]|uniref:ABC transporter permease n=1 Tax=Natronosalvus rutilus TaxID=2953753 RepID=A0A9E7SY46_9EURY|nr:ABC transporter permease [Natronosalvus rutilus]UTF55706.1 ABC transporter permease [Natronosalvus rutilus]
MATEKIKQPTIKDHTIAQLRRAVQVYSNLDFAARVSMWLIVGIVLVAVFADFVAPYEPTVPDYGASVQGPSIDHPMGTDLTGRDILSRVIHGTRISLLVGVVAVSIAVALGVTIGSIAGYRGGYVDEVLMRGVDVMISFPSLILALALVGAVGASLQNIIIVIAIVYTPQYARLIRGDVLSVKEEEFVEAARGTGLSELKVLWKHVIPNAFTPVFVQATFHVATAIIFEASLSFLGLGVQPPTPTWGVLIADGRQYLPEGWWISTFPGLAIMFTVLAFNIFGDGLRDEIDPQTETTQEGA